MSDRLIPTTEVAMILGGLHPESVRRLIHAGQLKARPIVVRGKNIRPRLYVLESEVKRFMEAERPTMVAKLGRLERASRKHKHQEEVTGYY